MLTRILTAAVGVVIFFAAVIAPVQVFALAVFAVTAVMLAEMYKVLSCGRAVDAAGFVGAAAAAAGVLKDSFSVGIVVYIMLYMMLIIAMHGKRNVKDIMTHAFVTLFISAFMCCIIKLRIESDAWNVIWVFLIAWLTDSGAYFAGVFLGKHKLVPNISPKKTVEGSIGGIAAAVAACVAYYTVYTAFMGQEFVLSTALFCAVMGLIGSVLSQMGDLLASCIKRDFGVKDYGNILPGHGGLMDRFDSVVFIAPFVYYAVILLQAAQFAPTAQNGMIWSYILG